MFKRLNVTYKIDGKTYNQSFNDTTSSTVIWLISLRHSKSTSCIDIMKIEEF